MAGTRPVTLISTSSSCFSLSTSSDRCVFLDSLTRIYLSHIGLSSEDDKGSFSLQVGAVVANKCTLLGISHLHYTGSLIERW